MKPWHALAWSAGMVGAVVTGTAVSLASYSSRIAVQRRNGAEDDPYQGEALGRLEPDRGSTVAADDGVPLAVQEVRPADGGEAELTVVLVHGYSLDSRCWHFQRRDLPRLSDPNVRLVLYDQRSHGRSGHSRRANCTIEQLGRDLDAVLRATARRGPVVLAGHSMGGMAIMALAEQRPELFRERIAGVALLSTSAGQVGARGLPKPWLSKNNPLTRTMGVLAQWQPSLVESARRSGSHVAWNAVRRLAFGDRDVDTALVDLTDDMIASTTVETVTDFLDTLGSHDRTAALAGLRHSEVLVMGGDADRLIPFSHSETIAARLSDAELVRLEGAGHMAILERAEPVTERLSELVRRVARDERAEGTAEKVSGS
ncbi:Pimeloyl-ACP methyl ester carboxylesterase [Actinopolyspora lacussalsi subsp. righensis]|uniref:Pimeloyl-ACP methyl ester carboxylesterase n=1 Tax=Actinopolyspora righensis TaxID=995060 RepID=A0A1I6Z6I1_9ACTN|nr:alpha/beta hydrolase [Actinopolyspora righensis]SFT58317.1 Pimeloyl-ACP methyl ester carboxylesterase [Actinopolyspora righensis]